AHMSLAEKDLGIVLDAAEAHGLDLKVAAAARERWADAIRGIGADHDIAEIVRLVDPEFSGGGWHGGGDAVGSGTAE
ncbi:MAG: NAD-binding protein, partial [Phycisphaeraceae bacterium]|nr:NAD-binding protein [Phycisphaeraceae bacterium]